MTLNEVLKETRKAKGLTLRQVENATSISNAYLSQLESGKIKRPSLKVVKQLQEYYGLILSHIPTGDTYNELNVYIALMNDTQREMLTMQAKILLQIPINK